MIPTSEIAGIILAGGKASRMDFQDKALLQLRAKPMIDYVVSNASRQVSQLLVSVNRNPEKYDYLGCPVIPDFSNEYAGPLVGIFSAMHWLVQQADSSAIKYLACFAADVPLFPADLVTQLADQLIDSESEVAWCQYQDQVQPLFSLWSLHTLPVLQAAIAEGIYGPKLLIPSMKNILVDITTVKPGYFLNINSEDDLAEAESLLSQA